MTRRFVAQRFHHSSRRATEMFRHYCWYSDRSFKTEELRRRSEVKEEICAYASWCILANLQRHTLFSYTNTACTSLSLSLSLRLIFSHTNTACVSPQTPYPQLPYQIGCHNVPKTRIMAALLLWFMTQIRRREHAVLMSNRLWQISQIFA